jgi:hypothetical protein
MTSSNEKRDSNPVRDRGPGQGSSAQLAYLELARQIARETLAADHQALEIDAKFVPAIHADGWPAQRPG